MKDCAGVVALHNADWERRKYMIIKQAELETVCGITSKLPENEWPEVAFAGKSNVGKSSPDQRTSESEVPGQDIFPAG